MEEGEGGDGFFSGVEDKYGVWVGCCASRPMNFMPSHSWEANTGGDRDGLLVEFEDLEISDFNGMVMVHANLGASRAGPWFLSG